MLVEFFELRVLIKDGWVAWREHPELSLECVLLIELPRSRTDNDSL